MIGARSFPIGAWPEISRFVVERQIPAAKLLTRDCPVNQAAAFRLVDERQTEKAVFGWE